MAHAEVVLPYTVAVGFESDVDFPVDIVKTFNNYTYANLNAEDSVRKYRASITGKTRSQSADLYHFAMARGVSAQTFNHKDHIDYSVSIDQGVFTSLGSSQYQMWKRYSSTGTRDRKILKLDTTDLVVKAGSSTLILGSDYTVSATTGIVTAAWSPTVVPTTWSVSLFYTPVRFLGPLTIRVLVEDPELFTWGSLTMEEVLNP